MRKIHYLAIFITVCFAVILSISILALVFSKKPETEVILEKPARYEYTLECERISSQATNESWSYTNCLKNMEEATRKNNIQLN